MSENDQDHEEGTAPVEVLPAEQVPDWMKDKLGVHVPGIPVTVDHPQVAPQLPAELSAIQVVDQVRLIQEVMKSVMKEGIDGHYGKIPGCGDKPTLLKAGAEKLSLTFRMAPKYQITIRDIEVTGLPFGHREVEIVCSLYHIGSERFLGQGVGTCSTMESKYRYRDRPLVCPSCKTTNVIKGKDQYGGGWLCWKKKGGCGSKWPDGDKAIEGQETGKIENDNPADVWNTVLKIGKKRAHVDAVLTATAASDIFSQDLEDLPKGGAVTPPTDAGPKPGDVPVQKAPPRKRAAPKKKATKSEEGGGVAQNEERGYASEVAGENPAAPAPSSSSEEPAREGVPLLLDPVPEPPEPIYSYDALEVWGDRIWAWWKAEGWSDHALSKAARDKSAMPIYCRECQGPCYERERGYDEFVCMGKSGSDYCPELDEHGVEKKDPNTKKPYRLGWRKAGEMYRHGEWFDRTVGGWPHRLPVPTT